MSRGYANSAVHVYLFIQVDCKGSEIYHIFYFTFTVDPRTNYKVQYHKSHISFHSYVHLECILVHKYSGDMFKTKSTAHLFHFFEVESAVYQLRTAGC